MKISVIVPVYNVQDYLSECVQSILNQTFSDFELLLIDDGSTDHSGEIADQLEDLDPRIQVYHKKNGGLSDARNYGLERAQGEYLAFIDSDDYVAANYLETLINLIVEYSADASCLIIQMVTQDNAAGSRLSRIVFLDENLELVLEESCLAERTSRTFVFL